MNDKDLLLETGVKAGWDLDSYERMKEFLKQSIPFTAVVYLHEHAGIVKALEEKSLKVPEDVSIVGIGGISKMTVVTNTEDDMGKAAAERLLEMIANPGTRPKRVIVPSRLKIGNSVKKI